RGGRQAVGDLGVLLDLPQRHPRDGHEARLLPAGRRVLEARAGRVAEVDAVAQPAGVGALHAEADDDLRQPDAARQDADPVLDARAVEEHLLVVEVRAEHAPLVRAVERVHGPDFDAARPHLAFLDVVGYFLELARPRFDRLDPAPERLVLLI